MKEKVARRFPSFSEEKEKFFCYLKELSFLSYNSRFPSSPQMHKIPQYLQIIYEIGSIKTSTETRAQPEIIIQQSVHFIQKIHQKDIFSKNQFLQSKVTKSQSTARGFKIDEICLLERKRSHR